MLLTVKKKRGPAKKLRSAKILKGKIMKSEQNKGYIMVFIAGMLWGTIGLFSTLLSKLGMDSSAVAFFRLLAASILLVPILIVKGKGFSLFRISKKGLISCALIGFISQAFYNLCYMKAIEMGGMATAAVLLYTSPVFVAIMSRVLFKEPLGRNKLAAIAINIIGCVLTVTGGDFSAVKLTGFALLMGVLAGFTYGTMPIFSRFGADNEDPYTSAFYGLALGALLLFFIVRPYNGMGTEWNWQIVLVLIGFGIVPSALGYIVYFGGLSKVKETSVVPVLASIETVAASVIGLVVFGQSLSLGKVAGIALVVCSILIMNLKKKEKSSYA